MKQQRRGLAQIAAWYVITRDLPDFDGNPEDGPILISQYEITTESNENSSGCSDA